LCEKNFAEEGGCISWETVSPSLKNLNYSGNTATYGPDIASRGTQLNVTDDNGNSRKLETIEGVSG
jgi:hypothetical protein